MPPDLTRSLRAATATCREHGRQETDTLSLDEKMPRYAAVDIGSNSAKLQVSDARAGAPPQVLTEVREVTRLGASVFRSNYIDDETTALHMDVLAKMAQTFQKYEVVGVRAVATSAVRDAANGAEFVRKASDALGVKVEVISGQEEARLVYLGVESAWPQEGRIMAIDVGGGSGEIIVGEEGRMIEGISRPLGAVRLTEMFLHSDPPEKEELEKLNHFIDEKLALAVKRLNHQKVTRVIGTSSTAAATVCGIRGIPRARRSEADRMAVTSAQVRAFARELAGMSLAARRKITGIGPRRAEIIVAGAAVFARILETFELPELYHSVAGVRDGIIADLVARGVGRELIMLTAEQRKTVEALAQKFGISIRHGKRVGSLAHQLFEALQPLHLLPPNDGKLLEAACYLLDAGHYISSVGHHKHSQYVVQNADLPGFTERERLVIAMLCRYHRKAMPASKHADFENLTVDAKRTILYLTPIVRIADALPGDLDHDVASLQCEIDGDKVKVLVKSDDLTLDLWAADQAGKSFKDVYNRPISFQRVGVSS